MTQIYEYEFGEKVHRNSIADKVAGNPEARRALTQRQKEYLSDFRAFERWAAAGFVTRRGG